MSDPAWWQGGQLPTEIAESINRSFCWSFTPQGADFWDNVYRELKNLQSILDGGTPTIIRSRGPGTVAVRVPVSSGSSHRCVDCSLLRCAAPDNRCPECDLNINGGKTT